MERYKKPTVVEDDTVMWFGKHKGKTMDDLNFFKSK